MTSEGDGVRPILATLDNLEPTLNEQMDTILNKAFSELQLRNPHRAEEVKEFYQNGNM